MSVPSKPIFVILHGLANTKWHIRKVEKKLSSLGYETWSITYPSMSYSLEEIADFVGKHLELVAGNRPLIGIGHSMGGIVLRLLSNRFNWIGSVLIGTPNGGSSAAKHVFKIPIFNRFYGPAARELATRRVWPDPPQPSTLFFSKTGVSFFCPQSVFLKITGWSPKEDHDGMVTVSESKSANITRFCELPLDHVRMINHPQVIYEACKYLIEEN